MNGKQKTIEEERINIRESQPLQPRLAAATQSFVHSVVQQADLCLHTQALTFLFTHPGS
jgi:hypothetical protein